MTIPRRIKNLALRGLVVLLNPLTLLYPPPIFHENAYSSLGKGVRRFTDGSDGDTAFRPQNPAN